MIEKQTFQLDAALENMSQGLCMFDASRRLIVCNKRYAELYGLTDEQTKPGTTIGAILEHRVTNGNAPEDHEGYIKDRLNEVAVNHSYQFMYRLCDGRYVSVVHRPLPGGGWVATHEDVTEAKAREDSFRLLFEGNPVPMWVIDRETLRFVAVNEAAIAHYGYTREQFMAMTLTDLRPAADRERFAKYLRTLSNVQLTGEYRATQEGRWNAHRRSRVFSRIDLRGPAGAIWPSSTISPRSRWPKTSSAAPRNFSMPSSSMFPCRLS